MTLSNASDRPIRCAAQRARARDHAPRRPAHSCENASSGAGGGNRGVIVDVLLPTRNFRLRHPGGVQIFPSSDIREVR